MKIVNRYVYFLFLCLLTGCVIETPVALTATPNFQPTETLQQATPGLMTIATLKPALTPTSTGCAETTGMVERFALPSVEIDRPLPMLIYTPPCYDPGRASGYPVLYLLHGQSFNELQWQRLGVPETADRLISAHEVHPFLVVMPQEYDYLKEIGESNYGKALVAEVLPWVEAHYNVCKERNCRAIGGLSRGASWAALAGF